MARIYGKRTCDGCGGEFSEYDYAYCLTRVQLDTNYHSAISMDPRGVFKIIFQPRAPKRLYHPDCFRRLCGPGSPLSELTD
jgi:hypothetical protein